MIKFDDECFVKNLPDTYRKDVNSNNHKLLQMVKYSTDILRKDIQDVLTSLNLNEATGKTLDLYGEVVVQPRQGKTDAQYRLDILAKIIRNMSTGSYDSIINAICFSFGCNPDEVQIAETENAGEVDLLEIPLNIVEKIELSQNDIVNIITQMLPVGVSLNTFLFTGTFEFGSTENESDNDKGFANDTQTIGGHFGNIANMDDIRTNALGVSMFANFKLGG